MNAFSLVFGSTEWEHKSRAAAEDIVLAIVSRSVDVAGVYLHGSFIAGTHTPIRKIIINALVAWAGRAWEIIHYGFHCLDFKTFFKLNIFDHLLRS